MKQRILWLAMLALPLAFVLVSCDDDDDDNAIPDAVETLRQDAQFSTLVAALEQTGLDDQVAIASPETIFAPTNDAFAASGIDLGALSNQELSRVLLYHVISGARIESSDIEPGQTYISSSLAGTSPAYGVSQLITNAGGTITIQGSATVVDPNIQSSNAVIHGIDGVLLPPDVVDHAIANENFTSLVAALGAASGDLVNVLKGDGPFTVFAPVNSAFDAISGVVATLTPDQLSSVLTYHVVAGAVHASDLSNGQVVTTVNGDTFTVGINGSNVTLTDTQGGVANVILTDVEGTNGVIHVLDKVLLPQQ